MMMQAPKPISLGTKWGKFKYPGKPLGYQRRTASILNETDLVRSNDRSGRCTFPEDLEISLPLSHSSHLEQERTDMSKLSRLRTNPEHLFSASRQVTRRAIRTHLISTQKLSEVTA